MSLHSHSSFSVGRELRCLYFNARSIYCKRFDLAAYLAACECDFDIISVTESFLDSSISSSLIVPTSYVGHRLDRNRHGGGLLVMVREIWSVTRRFDLVSCFGLNFFTPTGPVLFGTFIVHPILIHPFYILLIIHYFQSAQNILLFCVGILISHKLIGQLLLQVGRPLPPP